jgi:hypothetical protein
MQREWSQKFPNLRVGITPTGGHQDFCVDCDSKIVDKCGYHGDLCDECEEYRAEYG